MDEGKPQRAKKRAPYAGLDLGKVCDVILQEHGLLTQSAERLGTSRATLLKYCQNHPTVLAVLNTARESTLDLAERRLFDRIDDGEKWAVCYYLSSQGKSRGYGPVQFANSPDFSPMVSTINIIAVPPGQFFSQEEVRSMMDIDNPLRPKGHLTLIEPRKPDELVRGSMPPELIDADAEDTGHG